MPRQSLPGAAPRRRAARLGALLLLLVSACRCPPDRAAFATPLETLSTWQARLCRDDPQAEYACLARSFQLAMGGFETYWAARTALLERDPAAAWLFSRAELSGHVVAVSEEPGGWRAALLLAAGDAQVQVLFEREAFVSVTWDDGRSQTLRQRIPPAQLFVRDDRSGRQWLALERPDITEPRHVREVRVELRWLIADIAGLAQPATDSTEIVP